MKTLTISIKTKLLLLCMAISLLMTFTLFALIYSNTRKSNLEREIKDAGNFMNMALLNMEQDYYQIISFSHALSNTQSLSLFLLQTQDQVEERRNYYSLIENTFKVSGKLLIDAYTDVSEMNMNFGISDLLVKCIITSKNHNDIIAIGSLYGYTTDYAYLMDMSENWEEIFPAGIVKSPFYYSEINGQNYIIPIHSKIYSYNGSRYIGDAYMAISDRWLTRQLQSIESQSEDEFLIKINKTVYSYVNGSFLDVTDLYASVFTAPSQITYTNMTVSDTAKELDGRRYVRTASKNSSIELAQLLHDYHFQFFAQDSLFLCISYMAIIFIIVVFIYMILNYIIKSPINQICYQLKMISGGNFHPSISVQSHDEFQLISEEIVKMSENIEKLMEQAVEAEKLKQNYQFRMLQNQINPHFLYNTLNSIRWMGEMNSIPGIVDMTSAFIKLLRQIFRSSDELVPLQEELEFIENYGLLQSYRYGNTFEIKYQIDDMQLLNAQMIKFTLQPLVENAIFHGIEPTHSKRTIQIRAEQRDADLLVHILDDGIGIAPDTLQSLNCQPQNQPSKKDERISGIGINNIKERIKIEFGENYGLHISSEFGKYTCATIHVPLVFLPKKENKI